MMASSPTYAVKFRRRRLGRTNYHKRLALLKSGKPRLVVRVSNKYVVSQLVESASGKDRVLFTVSSKELSKHGWNHSFKNIPAAYLTGIIAGKKCSAKEVILDAGVSKPSSRVFALIKGFVDAGANIAHSQSSFPSAERLAGKHVNDKVLKDAEVVKEKLLKDGKETGKKTKRK